MVILLVEDEVAISRFVKKGLELENHTVHVAYDGIEALGKAQSFQFDIILMDNMLPKINGIDVVKKLRSENNTTPIIMVTARDSVEYRNKSLWAGANDYLVKPFMLSELFLRIKALTGKKKNNND